MMDDRIKKNIFLIAFILFIGLGFYFSSNITGNATYELCKHNYDLYHNKPWFETWSWFINNCGSYLEHNQTLCGNGLLDAGEDCETSLTMDCKALGFISGNLYCSGCNFDTTNCVGGEPGVPPTGDCQSIIEELANCNNNLGQCQNSLSDAESEISSLNTQLATCQQELDDCLQSSGEGCDISCMDEDGGKNFFVGGSTIGYVWSHDDSCNGDILTEYYCTMSQPFYGSETQQCQLGCENGRCLNESDIVTITGSVTNPLMQPINGAIVTLNNEYVAYTNIQGLYTLQESIDDGTYELKARKEGYNTSIIFIQVVRGGIYQQNFVLSQQ
jgi:hypothetical protein